MRLFGFGLMFVGVGLLIWGANYGTFLVLLEGDVGILQLAEWKPDRVLTLIMGGFTFLSGAVLFGAGAIVAAIKESSARP